MQKHDNLFANPLNKVADFKFDESVVDVFPDMIQRSVPGYESIIHTIGELAKSVVTEDSNVYDLGCSLGAASLSVARATESKRCNIIGVDSSQAMVERCKRMVQAFNLPNPIDIIQQNKNPLIIVTYKILPTIIIEIAFCNKTSRRI